MESGSFVVKMNLEHSNYTWPVQWIVPALEQAPTITHMR